MNHTDPTPKISVIIPAYDAEQTLAACLASVAAQTYPDYEIIVVDNASTDGTKRIVEDFQKRFARARYVFEGRRGRGSVRNAGIRAATGDIIAMTDSDCIVPADWLQRLASPIIKEGEMAVMGSEEPACPHGGSAAYWSKHTQIANAALLGSKSRAGYIAHVDTKNLAMRAGVLRRHMFDGSLAAFEDWDLFLRIKDEVRIRFMPDILVAHHHPISYKEVFATQAERARNAGKIRRTHPELRGSGFAGPVLGRALGALGRLAKHPARLPYAIISALGWQAGMIRSRREPSHIQLAPAERRAIIGALDGQRALRPAPNFLVFGLGNDSALWSNANAGGRTAFIEDDPRWFEAVTAAHPYLEAHLVDYGSKRSGWKEIIDRPDLLARIEGLPVSVSDTEWDVILVDGPAGYADGAPGRMKSIFLASRLARPGGDIFIHDSEREIEREYGERYIGAENIIGATEGRALLLRYRMPRGRAEPVIG